MSLVPFHASPPVRVFLLPVLFPIPDLTQSHIPVQTDLPIVSMRTSLTVSLRPTLSLSVLIAF